MDIIIKKKIETGIVHGFSIISIFFLIYISEVFNKVLKTSLLIIFPFFVNDLGFIALNNLEKEIVEAFKIVAKEIIEWGMLNSISYNMPKMKAMFFSKSPWQQLNKHL